MLYIIYQEDQPRSAAIRAVTKAAHLAYLELHKDKLVLGGALLSDENDARLGSCLIINVPNREAAEEFSRNEPLRMAGAFESVKIRRMRRGQWNPAAAPNSEEGD